MQSNKKSKIEKKKGAKIKAAPKKKNEELSEESFSKVKKLISKFLTNLCEKKYSEAHKDLEQVVEAKVKNRIAKTAMENKNKKNNKKGSE